MGSQTIPIEADEQKKLVQYLKMRSLFFFAPTNENNTSGKDRRFSAISEQKAKSMGKVKGVPDLVVFTNENILFIELKRQKKKLKSGKLSTSHTKVSKEQELFLETASRYKYVKSTVCYGANEAIEFIEKEIK